MTCRIFRLPQLLKVRKILRYNTGVMNGRRRFSPSLGIGTYRFVGVLDKRSNRRGSTLKQIPARLRNSTRCWQLLRKADHHWKARQKCLCGELEEGASSRRDQFRHGVGREFGRFCSQDLGPSLPTLALSSYTD